MIRVLICDDQVIYSEGLRIILNTDPNIEVVGLAHDGEQAMELIKETHPDLVLMDLKMPGMNGVRATREIGERFPHIRVLVLTTYRDDTWMFDAIRSGAAGYLTKDIDPAHLITAIHGTMRGQSFIDPSVAGNIMRHIKITDQSLPSAADEFKAAMLSGRELEIFGMIARGLTNEEIANQLHLSLGTVRNHVTTIIGKLNVENRTQVAIIALHYGLVRSSNGAVNEKR